jgi:protein-S-isoprenylcysteine O-methyltransferase Ste14
MKQLFQITPQLIGTTVLIFLMCTFNAPWNAARWIGLAITGISAVFLLAARHQLGCSFSVSAQARQLVTHGIYSRIRNPIYVFSTQMLLGAVIAYQRFIWFVPLACLVIVQVIRAHRESQVLEMAFGDAYREYRKRTWF